jgi:hypothetical protein
LAALDGLKKKTKQIPRVVRDDIGVRDDAAGACGVVELEIEFGEMYGSCD